ncbi:uncharacterized protein LOC124805207 isoform X2 [Schistocerca piceifrons]|uniref:uncharacterized protein LOC124805207 isoform X2 n=1 Tax=Schistocerca piceifrons TaxID=274613 RepID=UPI001F5F956A|nr:uncharacterized protein LOC124805207 isoform X2 [Schistocerca piceifrons]
MYEGYTDNESQGASQAIVPTKTKDITKIKGWRTKQFLVNNNPPHASRSSSCSSAFDWEDKYGSSSVKSVTGDVKESQKDQPKNLDEPECDEHMQKRMCTPTFSISGTSLDFEESPVDRSVTEINMHGNDTVSELSLELQSGRQSNCYLAEKTNSQYSAAENDVFRPFDGASMEISQDCEKSAFISDVLDNFLITQSELKISFEVPSLAAEEAISCKSKENAVEQRHNVPEQLESKHLKNVSVPDKRKFTGEKLRKADKKLISESKVKLDAGDSDSRSTFDGHSFYRSADRIERGIDDADISDLDEMEAEPPRRRLRRLRPTEVPNYNEDSVDSDSEGESRRRQPHRKTKKVPYLRSSKRNKKDNRMTTSESERDSHTDSLSSLKETGVSGKPSSNLKNVVKTEKVCISKPPSNCNKNTVTGLLNNIGETCDISFSFIAGIGKKLPEPVIQQLNKIRSDTYQIDANWANFAVSVLLPAKWDGVNLPKQRIILPARKTQFIFEETLKETDNSLGHQMKASCSEPEQKVKQLVPHRIATKISKAAVETSPRKLTLLKEKTRFPMNNNRSTSPDPDCIIIEEFQKKEKEEKTANKPLCKETQLNFIGSALQISNVKSDSSVSQEVCEVVRNILTYVANKENGDRVHNDPDTSYSDTCTGFHRTVRLVRNCEKKIESNLASKKKKTVHLVREMERLGVNVIEMNAGQETICEEDFCRLGCVCKSLKTCKSLPRGHCGEVSCMFDCKCISATSFNKEEVTNNRLLSPDMLLRLQNEVGRNLAKKEREFHQTVIKGDEGVIVVGGDGNIRKKRDRKLPGRYRDSVLISHLTVPQIKALAKNEDERTKSRYKSDSSEIKVVGSREEKPSQEKYPIDKIKIERTVSGKLRSHRIPSEKVNTSAKAPLPNSPVIIQLPTDIEARIVEEGGILAPCNPKLVNSNAPILELEKVATPSRPPPPQLWTPKKSVITNNSEPGTKMKNGTVPIRSQILSNICIKDLEITKVVSEGESTAQPAVQEPQNDVEIKVIACDSTAVPSSTANTTLEPAVQGRAAEVSVIKKSANAETIAPDAAADSESGVIEKLHNALKERYGIEQSFVSINKVKGIKKRPYCMEHDEYGCDCIKRRIPPSPLCELIKLNTAIKRLCSPPLSAEQRRQLAMQASEQQTKSRNVAVKRTTPLNTVHVHNLQRDSARTAGISHTYLSRRFRSSVIRLNRREPNQCQNNVGKVTVKSEKGSEAGIQIAAVTTLTLEEFCGQKPSEDAECATTYQQQGSVIKEQFPNAVDTQQSLTQQSPTQLSPAQQSPLQQSPSQLSPPRQSPSQQSPSKSESRKKQQLGSKLISLLQGSSNESRASIISEGNSFPDLNTFPKGHIQVVNWNFLKQLFEMNNVFVWLRVLDTGMKLIITPTNRQPSPQFINLKKMRKLQGFPSVVQNLVIPGRIENSKYAILRCDGSCWQIAGTITNRVKGTQGEQAGIQADPELEEDLQPSETEHLSPEAWAGSGVSVPNDRIPDGGPFAELRSKISPARFKAKMLELLAAGESTDAEMRFELADVNVNEETYCVTQGLYTLPRGADKFHWFSVPLVKKYDMVYVASKRCGVEYEEMLDMVYKSMRDKVALCKPLLERREGYVLVNDLSCPKFGVYATFEAPQKLLFGPFTATEQHRISLHRLVMPPNPGPAQSVGGTILSSLQKSSRTNVIHRTRKVPCVLYPMMPSLGYIPAVRLHTGEITFRHFFIKDQELMFPNMDAVDTWLDKFLQSRILYVPKQLRVKWKCVPLECFDPAAKKVFDTKILNGNHVMTVVGVFDLYEMKYNNAAAYGLKNSLLHKLKEKLRRRDVMEGFNVIGRVLLDQSDSGHMSKLQLLRKAREEIRQLEADFVKLSFEKNQLKNKKQSLLKRMSYKEDVENIVSELKKVWEVNDTPPVVELTESEDADNKENICKVPLFLSRNTEGSTDKTDRNDAVIDIASSDSDLDDYLSDDQMMPETGQNDESVQNKNSDPNKNKGSGKFQTHSFSACEDQQSCSSGSENISVKLERQCSTPDLRTIDQASSSVEERKLGDLEQTTLSVSNLSSKIKSALNKTSPSALNQDQRNGVEVISLSDEESGFGDIKNSCSTNLEVTPETYQTCHKEVPNVSSAEKHIIIYPDVQTKSVVNTLGLHSNVVNCEPMPSSLLNGIVASSSSGVNIQQDLNPPTIVPVSVSRDRSSGQCIFKIEGGKLYVKGKTGETIPIVPGQFGSIPTPVLRLPETATPALNYSGSPPTYSDARGQILSVPCASRDDNYVPSSTVCQATSSVSSVSSWHVPCESPVISDVIQSNVLPQSPDTQYLSSPPVPVYTSPQICKSTETESEPVSPVSLKLNSTLPHLNLNSVSTLSSGIVQGSIFTQAGWTTDSMLATTGNSDAVNHSERQ